MTHAAAVNQVKEAILVNDLNPRALCLQGQDVLFVAAVVDVLPLG